jgi:hypothetical protein
MLHEAGHAVDRYNGNSFELEHPGRKVIYMLGGFGIGTVGPSVAIYESTGSSLAAAVVMPFAFLGTASLMGYVFSRLDKNRLSPEGRNEGFANDFEDRNYSRYSKIITLLPNPLTA